MLEPPLQGLKIGNKPENVLKKDMHGEIDQVPLILPDTKIIFRSKFKKKTKILSTSNI